MLRYVVVVLALAVPAIMATTGVKACRSNTPLPDSVDVVGCLATPCEVALNSTAQMALSFVARKFVITSVSWDTF